MDIDVKKIRTELGLTQHELAEKIGVDRRTILNYEKGEKVPDSKVKLLHFILGNQKIRSFNCGDYAIIRNEL